MSRTSPHHNRFVWRNSMPGLRLRVLDFETARPVLENYCSGSGVAVFARALSRGTTGTMVVYETEITVSFAVDVPEFRVCFAGTVGYDIGCGAEDEGD